MKNQALVSSKDKSEKIKCRLLQFLFGASRFKPINCCDDFTTYRSMETSNYLCNRFLLTVICFPIYRWLEVSHEVDISRTQSTSDILIDD